MDAIKKFLTNILKEAGTDKFCIARVLAVVSFVAFLAYAGVGLYRDHFALQEFSSGLMQVLLGSGGVLAGKAFADK